MISVSEYRKILNDEKTSEEQIKKRVSYIETFCRNVIKYELEKYVENNKKQKKEVADNR